jgi:hypothetical protein
MRIGLVWPGAPCGIVDHVEQAIAFDVSPVLPYTHSASPEATGSALVLGDFDCRLEPDFGA